MLAEAKLDMVDICLPTASHAPAAIAALSAGRHVFCEKPIALKPADGIAMVEAAKRAGRMLMIGHVLPFLPEYRFAYDAIASGTYGRIKGGHFKRIISDPLWMPRFYDPAVIGGPMLDLHVHDAHFIRLACGMPRAVQCAGTMRGEVVERFHAQFRFEDPQLMVTAASGVIAQQGRPFTHGYEIYLEKATLLYDFAVIGGQPLSGHAPDRAHQRRTGIAPRVARRRCHHPVRERVDRSPQGPASRRGIAAPDRRPGPRCRRYMPERDRGRGQRADGAVLRR